MIRQSLQEQNEAIEKEETQQTTDGNDLVKDPKSNKLTRNPQTKKATTYVGKLAEKYAKIIPIPDKKVHTAKSLTELASLKALNMETGFENPSRYKQFLEEKKTSIYRPLEQPYDYDNPNPDQTFPKMRLPLNKLIDPADWQAQGDDLYPAEMFEHLTKLMLVIEKRKALVPALTRAETSFVYAVIKLFISFL